MDTPYILGLDGGQSSTICVLGLRDGTLLSVGRGGPANHIHQPGGAERLRLALTAAVGGCLAPVQPPVRRLAAAYLALTGGTPLAREMLPEIVPADRLVAEGDTAAALAGGTCGGPGIVLIAGTGAVTMLEIADGTRLFRGGWGYLLGDEGSGYWIGMQALRAAAAAEDGRGPTTPLYERILRHFAAENIREVAMRVYADQIGRPSVARLAPLVLACADADDAVAAEIVTRAADELAGLVQATCALAAAAQAGEQAIIATGGVLRPGNALWRRLADRIANSLPEYRLLPPRFPPVIGAFLLGLRLAGVELDGAVLSRVETSLAALPDIDAKGAPEPEG